nr:hypothetical protein [Tanacetum cinerariifolium]
MMLCLLGGGAELHHDHHHPLLLFHRSLLLPFNPHHLLLALTARKLVRPLPSHRLALRHTSHHLDHFTFESSSSHSSSNHSSSGHSITGHSLSRHTPPDTTDANSSTPSRFVHLSLARTPRCSEAYLHWRSAPLSTMYPPTTSESSARDSSSESSTGPSYERCRSSAATVISSIYATRASVPSRTDLLPPCKRFRDSISPEDSVKEIDTYVLEDIEADATAIEVAVNSDVEDGIYAGIGMKVDVGVDVEDEVESSDRGTMEVGVDVVAEIDIPDGMLMPDAVEHLKQRELEAGSLIAGRERASLLEQIVSLERSNARLQGTMMMERARSDRFRRRVRFMKSELRQIRRFCHYDRMRFRRLETFTIRRLALATYEATRAANALGAESQSQNGSDGDNENGGNGNSRNGNGGDGNGGDGNDGNGNGRNGNPNENNRDARHVVRECTYQDFMKCQPLNFKGTERVIGLTRWFEKMEVVFHISNCQEKYQVKYATCTLLNNALTWWNLHKRTVRTDAAFAMSWRELIKLMAKVVDYDVHQDGLEKEDRVKKFIGGLPDNIQGNVIPAKPMSLQDAVWIANNLMDQKLKGYAVKNTNNKRRLGETKETTVDSSHHSKGQMIVRSQISLLLIRGGQVVNQRVVTCFECGRQGHYRSDCPKLKDQNRRNKDGNKNGIGEARGKEYVLGAGDANPDSNVVKGSFLLNNHYAFVLFDSGADRSFVSTTFSTLLDVTPDTLNVRYDVELADERISETLWYESPTCNPNNPAGKNIDLMPVELSIFDVIICMDWLANHHAVIVCDKKIV